MLWKRGETRNRVLVEHLLKTELSALAEAMEGTVAQSIVDPANPKTALSVRAMLTANIGAMDLLPDEGNPFSIRQWIEREGGGFLFLTSRGDQHASLRGLISTWLEIAVNALLSLPREDGRRIWLILDELPTLHQLPSLRPGLAESRQFGGCFVLGVQVFSALRDLYGRDGAETISGLCGTRVVLAAPDRDTSEWSAESLGRVEVEALAEGVSYDTPRDGVTLSARRDLRSLVLPAEVSRLENLSGYLKFPGAWPVARIRLKYKNRTKVAERFVPRAEGENAGGSGVETPADDAAVTAGGGSTTAGRSDTPLSTERSAGGGADGEPTASDEASEGLAEPADVPGSSRACAADTIQGELELSCPAEDEGAAACDGSLDGPTDESLGETTDGGVADSGAKPTDEPAKPAGSDKPEAGTADASGRAENHGRSHEARPKDDGGRDERHPMDWQ